jgi:PAS domain S-box-containing protein
MSRVRARLAPYGVAIMCVVAVLLVSMPLTELMGPGVYKPFVAAVLVAAWYGGRGPAVLAVLLSVFAIGLLFNDPIYELAPPDAEDWVRMAVFLAVSALVIGVVKALQAARHRAEESGAEAQRQREVARAAHERVNAMLSRIADCFYSLDSEWRFAYLNPQAGSHLGRTQEELLGRTLWEVFPHLAGTRVEEEFRHAVDAQTPVRFEAPSDVASDHWLEYRVYPAPDGLSIFFVDITEQKRLEAELRQAQAALQERAEMLVEADRAKDRFLAMLAHELRNPLAPIRNAVHLLKQLGPDEPRRARLIEVVDRQVGHQARLLDDLLDLSRISRGRIHLRPERLDLGCLVRNTAEDRRGVFEAAGLTLSLELPEAPVWVEGDPTRLSQVLGNLLQNSGKFTDRGGRVTVRLTPLPEEGRVALCVRDTGIGIEPEMLPRVFDTFAQADRSLERSRSGLGLGLALVRGLVELHGGDVRAASKGIGRGSEFTIRLPLAPAPLAAEAGPAPAAAATGPVRMLIVEDNRDAADTLRELLELCGCTVAVAYSGLEALEMAGEVRPEVVLCDLGLPGVNGYEVAAALRQDRLFRHTRLIAVSGYGQEEDQRRAREAGFDLHLTKPVDLDELLRLLEVQPQRTQT